MERSSPGAPNKPKSRRAEPLKISAAGCHRGLGIGLDDEVLLVCCHEPKNASTAQTCQAGALWFRTPLTSVALRNDRGGLKVAVSSAQAPGPGRACGCWEAAAEHYGTGSFATVGVPIRRRQVVRPAAFVRVPPLLPGLLLPGSRGGADARVRLWLWLILEATGRVLRKDAPELELRRREWAGRLHLLGQNRLSDRAHCDIRARRIDNALTRLRAERVIEHAGYRRWAVLSEDRSGRSYSVESPEALTARLTRTTAFEEATGFFGDKRRYLTIRAGPSGRWERMPTTPCGGATTWRPTSGRDLLLRYQCRCGQTDGYHSCRAGLSSCYSSYSSGNHILRIQRWCMFPVCAQHSTALVRALGRRASLI